MPSMTEAMSGLAQSIAHLRQGRAEAASALRKATADRAGAVATHLKDTATARGVAARDYQAAAMALMKRRASDVGTTLAAHSRSLQARHHHRLDLAATQRRQLTAYMTGLTDSVHALQGKFRSELDTMRTGQQRHLATFMTNLTEGVSTMKAGFRSDFDAQRASLAAAAKSIHTMLNDARLDRQGAMDAWSGRKAAPPAPRTRQPEPAKPVEAAPKAKEPEPVKVAPPAPKPTMVVSPPVEAKPVAPPTVVPPAPTGHSRRHSSSSTASEDGKSS